MAHPPGHQLYILFCRTGPAPNDLRQAAAILAVSFNSLLDNLKHTKMVPHDAYDVTIMLQGENQPIPLTPAEIESIRED
jgi:hypothetical protein